MANLIIDIGNSRIKIALFNNRELIHNESLNQLNADYLQHLLSTYPLTNTIVSSVKNDLFEFEDMLKQKTSYIRFNTTLKISVNNKYKSINTLGLDRLAGMIGAQALFPNTNCLVIDAGTCITYDALDAEGAYYGGSISPGLNMRLNALHTFTGKLPLIDLDEQFADWEGHDTRSSILSGVVNGTVSELIGFIKNYDSRYSNLQIILCGGNAIFFDTRLKNSIFAHALKTEPHLVLIGLNEVIHQHND